MDNEETIAFNLSFYDDDVSFDKLFDHASTTTKTDIKYQSEKIITNEDKYILNERSTNLDENIEISKLKMENKLLKQEN